MLQFFLRTLLWPYPLKRQTLSSTSGARCPRQLECLCLRNAAGKAWRSLWITFHDPNDIIHGLHSRKSEDSCTLPPDALQYDCIFQTWCNNLLAAAKDSANCRMCAISRLTRCIRTVWHTSKIDSKLWVPGPRWHFSALVLSAWQKSREGHPICNMANVTHEARKVTRECQSAQFVSGQIWSAKNLWSFRKTAQSKLRTFVQNYYIKYVLISSKQHTEVQLFTPGTKIEVIVFLGGHYRFTVFRSNQHEIITAGHGLRGVRCLCVCNHVGELSQHIPRLIMTLS